jgi:hypothetical protein
VDELPLLVDLHERSGGKVLAISWDRFETSEDLAQTEALVADFAREQDLVFPIVIVDAEPDEFFAALGVSWRRIPQTWLVDGAGAVVHRHEGVLDADSAEELLGRFLELLEGASVRA